MKQNANVFKNDEKAIFDLRRLYLGYGYSKYTLGKFEEYDFYVRNKDFLISENIITFTDSDGKLMALKPDVTLSIVKNSSASSQGIQKLYYNENIYRPSGDTGDIKEMMQVGLECIGDIDDYCISEVVLLAAKSLECIADDYVIDISHMGIILAVLEYANVSDAAKDEILCAIAEKNVQTLIRVCEKESLDEKKTEILKSLVTVYGAPKSVIERLKSLKVNDDFSMAVKQLEDLMEVLSENGVIDRIRIDFSVVNNMKYYSGIAFKGFINGIPCGVLSGGQYDGLLKKMKINSKAIGFAVYLDMLEWLDDERDEYDVDTLIIYDETEKITSISRVVNELSKNGESVMVQRVIPEKIRYKKLIRIEEGKVKTVENNA